MKIMKELHRLALSFLYALRGIGYAVKTQRNFRIHLTALMVVVVFNTMAQLSATHWCIELLCCMVVISMELVNTGAGKRLRQDFYKAACFVRAC